jgi:hypothetical protein
MSKQPRFQPAAPGADTSFVSVMQHAPEVTARFFELYAAFWQHGLAPVTLKEMTRLRNARVTDCGY